ncbi:hypothetical protein [Arcicella rosea]|uniref:Uncharacterized protein n=1 Tax=Arcicella rosea TaxID=502909 RepID=A0A841F0W7_9BACT|nr:hypothetical protein [Arcicella rosea]MBB6005431.1 hypothetical protein [Arcicella rosea]
MSIIIALRGKGNSGKTTTIRILHNLLLANGYVQVRSNFSVNGGDFITIFSKKGKLIGVTSSGDTYDLVHDRLQEMVNANCNICVCACRTFDRSAKPGTNAAIIEFATYSNQFVEKTVDDNAATRPATNNSDAQNLLRLIDSWV